MMMLYYSYLSKKFNFIYTFLLAFTFFLAATEISLTEVSNNEVLISSENATFDQDLGIISLNENVILKLNNMTFKSDKMELFFEDKNNIKENFSNLKKIIARGNVFFEREQEIIKSDLVFFFPDENKLKISGNVKVIKGKNIGFKSEVLEINLKKINSYN